MEKGECDQMIEAGVETEKMQGNEALSLKKPA